MTPTEKIVADLCSSTFLSFWSFPNPIGKKHKELCDLLVVCDPYLIIFSVKDISIKESGNIDLDVQRWLRKAIDDSANQIYGAERILKMQDDVLLFDKNTKILLPKKGERIIYRVAVAFGRGDKFPIKYSGQEKGFIHVFDEKSIHIVLNELDTISDFITFLEEKEKFLRQTKQISFSVEDLLALYLQNGLSFPDRTLLIVADDVWSGYATSDEYKQEKFDNDISYFWDSIIETMYDDFINGRTIYGSTREQIELTVRQMNKESRFNRRQLSICFTEMLSTDETMKKINSRTVKMQMEGAPVYVFLTRPVIDRESRLKELQLRCLIAKQRFKDASVVIGIATEKYEKDSGYSLDLCYIDIPNWTNEVEQKVELAKQELNKHSTIKKSRISPDGQKLDFYD